MANYNYDEGGNLAAYFLITFLAIILVPTTLSLSNTKKKTLPGCQCTPCIEQRARNSKREQGSLLRPKLSNKSIFLLVGWSIMGFLCYKVAGAKSESTVYDPFEILGLKNSASEKEIKKHYKKLALKFHPDKVKLAVNQTIESASNYYVELTKAYKSLTDPEIRENLRKWGHPDGRQETSAGIALPKWVIEGKNNKWVLGVYGILFGGALPAIVGRWWFGSRQKTKDGITAQSAATFFKSLKEDSTIIDVVGILVKAYQFETITGKMPTVSEVAQVEKEITSKLGSTSWKLSKLNENSHVALVLLYAHMLRLDVGSSLANAQAEILLQTPALITAMFNLCIARNWLSATLSILRFSQYLTQAVSPGAVESRWSQLPGVSEEQSKEFNSGDMEEVLARLPGKEDVQKAVKSWGKLDIVDATYKVIGERVVVPAAIVYLVVKLRLQSPSGAKPEPELSVDETKRRIKANDAKDNAFLESKDEVERLSSDLTTPGYAHAPHWPGNRKPTWWLVLADDKSNRIVVPPTKITEIPHANPDHPDGRDYRSYKMQFQAPQGTGLFTWKIYLVSDTYIGDEVKRDITLKIDDVSALDAVDEVEDDISDPDEDTLAGQMAMMKGQKVKKAAIEEDSDDSSDTDGDNDSDSSSDSD